MVLFFNCKGQKEKKRFHKHLKPTPMVLLGLWHCYESQSICKIQSAECHGFFTCCFPFCLPAFLPTTNYPAQFFSTHSLASFHIYFHISYILAQYETHTALFYLMAPHSAYHFCDIFQFKLFSERIWFIQLITLIYFSMTLHMGSTIKFWSVGSDTSLIYSGVARW